MMNITVEILKEHSAPSRLISYMERRMPNGGDLNKIATNLISNDSKLIAAELVTWSVNHLNLSDDEAAAMLQCINSDRFYNCCCIKDCTNVVGSYDITNSNYIFYSDNIINSKDVVISTELENCKQCYGSQFCNNSSHLISCDTCENTNNAICSTFIISSEDIFSSNNITSSKQLYRCEDCENVFFSAWCSNLRSSFFCYETSGEYKLFNHQITEQQFELIRKQYLKLSRPLKYVEEWPEENLIGQFPSYTRNYKHFYQTQTDKFWTWIKTLPYYDPLILYKITCLKQFLG